MNRRVLHLLSQRPAFTGSGITVDALVREAARHGWAQRVVVGTPAVDPRPDVAGLPPEHVRPLRFGEGGLDFALPGMSDVMPYPSSRFAALTAAQLDRYRRAWRSHLAAVVEEFRPAVIHSHHVWLLSSLVKDVAPDIPVVTHCHATGLRQMRLCPHLAGEVRAGCARNETFVVLHEGHAGELRDALGVAPERIREVGAGYREEIFRGRIRASRRPTDVVYIGKYSPAKGLPWLLDAVTRLAPWYPSLILHVAGGGAGAEADALRVRMESMGALVRLHGQLSQERLAGLLRRCAVAVLPSFYEGLPLVLVEALACGCRVVATRLPGVAHRIAPHFGTAMMLVEPPRLRSVDEPVPDDLPRFVDDLTATLANALADAACHDEPALPPEALETFTWRTVFRRVEEIWREMAGRAGGESAGGTLKP
jgi:glycosyltransferase involved in cell wall biosynthesis